MKLFVQTDAPPHLIKTAAKNISWFTYGREFYGLLPSLNEAFRQHGPPQFIHIKGYSEYNYTWHVDLKKIQETLLQEILVIPKGLMTFKAKDKLNFFHGLINQKVSGRMFHFLFAFMRSSLLKIQHDEMASLYPPQTITASEDDFPLHCDLYIPKILFNAFENVPRGNVGSSLFVSTADLINKYMPSVKGITKSEIKRATQLLCNETGKDRYEKFYSLLYDERNVWSDRLKNLLYKNAVVRKFEKGQGYLINDRLWMHGRSSSRNKVSARRLHRLVFNNNEVLKGDK